MQVTPINIKGQFLVELIQIVDHRLIERDKKTSGLMAQFTSGVGNIGGL